MCTIAERINEGLRIRSLKPVDLVKRTGIGKSSISSYLSGKYEPKQENLYRIAKALDVSEAWLMGHDVPITRREHYDNIASDTPRGIKIPVLGYVRAGIPIEAIEEILDYEEISSELAATGDFFALSIKGDSMEPRILEGDVVIVRKQESVENGETAVVLVNGNDATVKKFYRTDSGVKLISTNPVYEPFFFTPKEVNDLPVSVIGKVVELRAKF